MKDSLKKSYTKTLFSNNLPQKSHCLNSIVLEDFETKLIITSLNEQNNIRNSITLDKQKNSLKVRHYSKISKPKTKPRQFFFSLFIGLTKLRNSNFFVFAENVKRRIFFLQKYAIYEVESIVFFCLETGAIDKEISEISSKLMSRGFLFSYDVDLTHPINDQNFQSFKTKRASNWLYMTNHNLMSTFFTPKTCEWVIPLVFGDIVKVKLNFEDFEEPGYLWIFKKISVLNMINVSDYNQFIQNIIGSHKIHIIEVVLQMGVFSLGLCLHFLNAPPNSQLTKSRLTRLVQIARYTLNCTSIQAIKMEPGDLEKMTQLAAENKDNSDELDINFISLEPVREYWTAFKNLFQSELNVDTKFCLSVALIAKDIDFFCSKHLSFLLTTFLFVSKHLVLLINKEQTLQTLKLVPVCVKTMGYFEAEFTETEEDKGTSDNKSKNPHSVNVFHEVEPFEVLEYVSTISKDHSQQDMSRTPIKNRVVRTSSVVFPTKLSKELLRRYHETGPDSSSRRRVSVSPKKSFDIENEESEIVHFQHKKFAPVENLISLKITKVNGDFSTIGEINDYFRNKNPTGILEGFFRFMTLKTERFDSNQDKLMHRCRQLTRSIFCNYDQTLHKLKSIPETPYFQTEDLTMVLFSLNLSGFLPSNQNFSKFAFLSSDKTLSSDIVILCFQEAILMKAANFKDMVLVESDGNLRAEWTDVLHKNMPEFQVGFSKQLCGLLLFFLVRKNLNAKVDIHLIETCVLKLGKFNLANKGCILANFKINHQKLMIVNCHLAAGSEEKYLGRRFDNLKAVIQMVEEASEAQDLVFLLGDLNFRVRQSMIEVNVFLNRVSLFDEKLEIIRKLLNRTSVEEKQKLSDAEICQFYVPNSDELRADFELFKAIYSKKQEAIAGFQSHDELLCNFGEINEFDRFELFPIKFMPTYRFHAGKEGYDTKEGKRIPSFTDRVLINKNHKEIFEMLQFDVDWLTDVSDHRPIFLIGKLKVLKENVREFGAIFDQRFVK